MRAHTHNELKLKKQLAPRDYKRDPNCKLVLKDGREVVLPAILLVALREGKVELRP